jgi:hypothetical protein
LSRALVFGLFAALVTSALPGQAAPPAKAPPHSPSPAAAKRAAVKPPLDFTGVWELDEKASRNVSAPMKNAVLSVRQTGNEIFIYPMGPAEGAHLLGETVVVDGRPYEKTLGQKETGYLTAQWGKDRKSLWLEVAAGPPEDPRRSIQRMVWTLSEDRKEWVRQSVSIQEGGSRESRLVFRRRAPGRTPTPVG